MLIILLLSIYSLGVTGYLVWRLWATGRRGDLDDIWESVAAKPDPSPADIKTMARLAKVRQGEVPWYERSISTIGIIAFFSMLIATSIQTVNFAKTEVESASLKQEVKRLESQHDSWKKLIRDLSEVVVAKQASGGKLEGSEEGVLKQRLGQLEEAASPGAKEEQEKLKIYLALKRYDSASALVEESAALAGSESPENLLFLAEVSFLDGMKGRAKSLLKRFEAAASKQPVEWQLRFLILSAALGSDVREFSKQVASIKGVGLSEAEEWLTERVEALREQAKRRSLASAGDAR